MKRPALVLAAGVLVAALACKDDVTQPQTPSAPQGPSFTLVANISVTDLLAGASGWAMAVNDLGQVAGVRVIEGSPGTWIDYHPFLWQDGAITDLESPGLTQPLAINSGRQVIGWSGQALEGIMWQDGLMTSLGRFSPAAINDLGQIAGYVPNWWSGGAGLWQNGTMTLLGAPEQSAALDINNLGQIVGMMHWQSPETHAFLWQAGTITDLGTLGGSWSRTGSGCYHGSQFINDFGQIVGGSLTANGAFHAFLWQNGTMTDLGILAGTTYSEASGINNLGEVVGISAGPPSFEGRAFLWRHGTMTDLGIPGSVNSCVLINDLGQVVANSEGLSRPFLWHNGTITDLGAAVGGGSWAEGISNLGQVVGGSWAPDETQYRARLWSTLRPATPAEEITVLINDLNTLVANGVLNQGQVNGLLTKLSAVSRQLERENSAAATQLLQAFINQVRAYMNAGILSSVNGQTLIDAAQNAITQLGG